MRSKVAVVTGASRGIGRATASKLAKDGWCVAINYLHSRDEAEQLADEIGRGAALAVCADISKKSEAFMLIDKARDRFGSVDLLVNNAGICAHTLFQDISEEEWRSLFATNVDGAFFCTQAVLSEMISRKSGIIINIASVWGQTGGSGEVNYSATKAAVIGMTKALAKEVGPSGIRVNCIAPAATTTDMINNLSEAELEDVCDEAALMILAKPEDIANTVSFLASDAAALYTGQILCPNGGFYI